MDNSFFSGMIVKIAGALLVLALVDLAFINYWIFNLQNSQNEEGNVVEVEQAILQSPSPIPQVTPSPAASDETTIDPPQVQTNTVVEKQNTTVIQNAQKEVFIPIGSGNTKSKSFSTLNGVEVTIDTTKYGEIDNVLFEATIWVEGGNGKAYGRLINLTDNNPFVESELSSSSSTGEFKASVNVPIPHGSRRYGIQAKTDIENFAAHVSNARIKITLK